MSRARASYCREYFILWCRLPVIDTGSTDAAATFTFAASMAPLTKRVPGWRVDTSGRATHQSISFGSKLSARAMRHMRE